MRFLSSHLFEENVLSLSQPLRVNLFGVTTKKSKRQKKEAKTKTKKLTPPH